jgi:hypothetical protein
VIASPWDYHGGAESRVSVRGNSGRYSFVLRKTKPPDRESNTLDHWTYLITLLVTKGTS